MRINTYECLHSLCKCLDLKKHFSNTATWLVQKNIPHFPGPDSVQGLIILARGRGGGGGSHRANCIECCVSPHTEVGARDIVGDGSRNDHKRDAELVILLPALHQFQAPCVSLRRQR